MNLTKEQQKAIEEVKQSVFSLVDKGEVVANCPKCNIALALSELENCKCQTCGPIDLMAVKIYYLENQA